MVGYHSRAQRDAPWIHPARCADACSSASLRGGLRIVIEPSSFVILTAVVLVAFEHSYTGVIFAAETLSMRLSSGSASARDAVPCERMPAPQLETYCYSTLSTRTKHPYQAK